MSSTNDKISLVHGDCDYHIFKAMQKKKQALEKEGVQITEFFGDELDSFKSLYQALYSQDLFLTKGCVIVRGILDGKKLFSFVKELTAFIKQGEPFENDLCLFHYGKIPKNFDIYKTVRAFGNVAELNTPKDNDILRDITKSVPITPDASKLLVAYTNADLFHISNEIMKLRNYLAASRANEIDDTVVRELCFRSLNQTEIWEVGSQFLYAKLQEGNLQKSTNLLNEVNRLLELNTAPMQILYSFYNYVLNAIKLQEAVSKGSSFKECMRIGYFFVKEFYNQKQLLNREKLFSVNRCILDVEYQVKTGRISDVLGVQKLLVA